MVDLIYNDISDFNEHFFESGKPISYIGAGFMGGKAKGLVSINDNLLSEINPSDFPDIETGIPKMVVILTDVFDAFMEQNNLYEIALSDAPDDRIAIAFQKAELPFKILGILRTFISKIHTPLAIRSSSLLEDSLNEPFAGIYGTKMTPNNQFDVDIRFNKLIEAIKFVYASTFFHAAKDYIKATKHKTEDEKMAVIIQEVVGSKHSDRYYPEISGVARSHNYYSSGNSKPEEGIVNLALGLGKTIVEGGFSWPYVPSYPKSVPPFNSISDMLKYTQTEFWAVNMGKTPEYDPINETEYLVKNGLECAENDNTLKHIASTYDVESDRTWIGLSGGGPRILNFAPILVAESVQLNNLIKKILQVCEKTFNAPVEIEFAVNLSEQVKRFGFLQVRPIAVSSKIINISDEEIMGEQVLISSENVLGNGSLVAIKDIIFADFKDFSNQTSCQVASEIQELNHKMVSENCPYLLIGYGRWGTSDPAAGIPVQWNQISGTRAIVEVPVEQFFFEMSQGSHFFHNVTSLKIFYFSLTPGTNYNFDENWLLKQKIVEEKKYVKHILTKNELIIKVDGRKRKGIIIKQ
ncbi:MAG: hypothetical protein JXJ22_16335 [Bacteroidales bacterium]|nr:hypothetical protein [Bacteroidales bacterium]